MRYVLHFFHLLRCTATLVLYYFLMNNSSKLLQKMDIPWQWGIVLLYFLLFIVCIFLWGYQLILAVLNLRSYWRKGRFFLEMLVWLPATFVLTNIILKFAVGHFIWELTTRNNQALLSIGQSLPSVFLLAMMLVFAPLVEELVFRESLIGWVPPGWKWLSFLCAAGVIYVFAMIHVQEAWEVYYYLGVSLSLTGVYMRFGRNVAASIFLHMLINIASYILLMQGYLN